LPRNKQMVPVDLKISMGSKMSDSSPESCSTYSLTRHSLTFLVGRKLLLADQRLDEVCWFWQSPAGTDVHYTGS
jgi:hypothetical protein